MSREAEAESLYRSFDYEPPLVPGLLSTDARAEVLRALRWIQAFSEAHHAHEPSGVHLHRLLVDIPHYLDYAIAILEEKEFSP